MEITYKKSSGRAVEPSTRNGNYTVKKKKTAGVNENAVSHPLTLHSFCVHNLLGTEGRLIYREHKMYVDKRITLLVVVPQSTPLQLLK